MMNGAYRCDTGFEVNIRETTDFQTPTPKTTCTIQTDIIIDY